jgi:hypothetical protein
MALKTRKAKYLSIKYKHFGISNIEGWSKLYNNHNHHKYLYVLSWLATTIQYKTNLCFLDGRYITTAIIAAKFNITLRFAQIVVKHWKDYGMIIKMNNKLYFNPYLQSKGKVFQTKILDKFYDDFC